MRGFEYFYIVDVVSKQVIFYTDRFYVPEELDCFVTEGLFGEFIEDYSKDNIGAIHNPKKMECLFIKMDYVRLMKKIG